MENSDNSLNREGMVENQLVTGIKGRSGADKKDSRVSYTVTSDAKPAVQI